MAAIFKNGSSLVSLFNIIDMFRSIIINTIIININIIVNINIIINIIDMFTRAWLAGWPS